MRPSLSPSLSLSLSLYIYIYFPFSLTLSLSPSFSLSRSYTEAHARTLAVFLLRYDSRARDRRWNRGPRSTTTPGLRARFFARTGSGGPVLRFPVPTVGVLTNRGRSRGDKTTPSATVGGRARGRSIPTSTIDSRPTPHGRDTLFLSAKRFPTSSLRFHFSFASLIPSRVFSVRRPDLSPMPVPRSFNFFSLSLSPCLSTSVYLPLFT